MAEETVAPGSRRSTRLAPGRIVGPYRIERQIGRGGMSVVYAATHIPLDRVVALKILLPSLSGDREFVERFLAEARSAARLDYPHIVPVYDTGEIDGVNFIAMKLLEGKDLKSVLAERREEQQGGLLLDRAISIASQAAGALEYAHQHRVIHRDVKPANIYVDGNDRVTLVDFGIARALDRSSTTLTGTVIGTPTYMSPEQAQGRSADYRSDIYSLGVVAYEMFAGAPPFTGQPQAVMHAHVYREPPPLSSLRPDVPRGVSEVVQRALAKDPNQRFQSAGTLALAMTNASGGELARQALEAREQPSWAAGPSSSDGDVSGSRSGSYTSPSIAEDGRAAVPAKRSRFVNSRFIVSTAAAIVAFAGLLVWAFIAGPLGAGGGRILVSSDPAGASVTVDGNRLGSTPLSWQHVAAGTHELILDKPGYVQVKRTEHIGARDSDSVNATLTPLPAAVLLSVKQAVVARDIGQSSGGAITIGSPVTGVRAEEPFGFVVTLVPKSSDAPDAHFRYEIALLDPTGNRLTGSQPTNATIKSSDSEGRSYAFTFTFHPNSDGSIPVGGYQLQFLIDGQAVVSRPISLSQ